MPNYKKMYSTLFNKITDIIRDLQEVQRQTENLYIKENEEIVDFSILKNQKENSNITILKK